MKILLIDLIIILSLLIIVKCYHHFQKFKKLSIVIKLLLQKNDNNFSNYLINSNDMNSIPLSQLLLNDKCDINMVNLLILL